MKILHTLLLAFSLLVSAPLLACTGSCVNDDDCAANACRYCDQGFSVCSDCCEFTEQVTCPEPPCTWTNGECRNIAEEACGVSVSELPANTAPRRGWMMAGLAGAVFGATMLLGFLYRRRRTRRF
jgi:hypothetical protein